MELKFTSIVEQGSGDALCTVVERHASIYGSLMTVLMTVEGSSNDYYVTPSDLTTHLVIPLPKALVAELELRPGQLIHGVLKAKEYADLNIPPDVAEELELHDADLSSLSTRQQRQGLLFIKEAHDPIIRRQRIDKFVAACRAKDDAK